MPDVPKRILDVGNCDHDHSLIRRMLEAGFQVAVDRAGTPDEAMEALRKNDYSLVLVNRLLDWDRSAGLLLIRRIKGDAQTRHIPVMLVSNYEDAQAAAVEAGAIRGFGKAELSDEATTTRLRDILA